MRTPRCVIHFFLFLTCSLPHFLTSSLACAEAELLAGAAKVELKLPAKVPLAGYSRRRSKPSTGVHDPVYARALVVRDAHTTLALVSCDLLLIDEPLYEAARRRLHTVVPVVTPTLFLAATHTHSGPGAYGQKFFEKLSMGHYDARVFEGLVESIVAAVQRAMAQMEPAASMRMVITTTAGLVVNRMSDDGVVDPELTVISLEGRMHHPVALIVGFNAHPTTLGASNRELSADYPGVISAAIERRFSGAVGLFVVGAVADQAPVKTGERFEPAQRLGTQLAADAQHALRQQSSTSAQTMTMAVAHQTIPLPRAHVRVGRMRLPSWLGKRLVDDDATLMVARIGPLALIGAPCDLSAELGAALKRHARERGLQPMIVGFANDYIGYCLPKRFYGTDEYEASLMFNGPDTGELLVNELKRMIDEVVRE